MSNATLTIGVKTPLEEVKPGIFDQGVLERTFSGEIIGDRYRWENHEKAHKDITANSKFSIVGSTSLFATFSDPLYVIYNNKKWVVSNVEYLNPRIIFTLGGLYKNA